MNDFLFLLRMSGSIWVPGSTIKDLTLEEINGHSSKCVACVQKSPPPLGKNRERRRRYKMRLFFTLSWYSKYDHRWDFPYIFVKRETVCSFWRGRQEQPDNVTDYKPRTKWCNNYAESRQLINVFTPKTKERDIRKYGKEYVSMGFTDRGKTTKNLVDSRKNWKILTVNRVPKS